MSQHPSVHPVLLVTIRFKKRGVLPNEFTVRLSSTDFGDTFTVKKLIDEGYKKLKNNSLTGRNFFLTIPQRLVGYGRYIGYNSDSVLAVYTEKDKGRISLDDIARYCLLLYTQKMLYALVLRAITFYSLSNNAG